MFNIQKSAAFKRLTEFSADIAIKLLDTIFWGIYISIFVFFELEGFKYYRKI